MTLVLDGTHFSPSQLPDRRLSRRLFNFGPTKSSSDILSCTFLPSHTRFDSMTNLCKSFLRSRGLGRQPFHPSPHRRESKQASCCTIHAYPQASTSLAWPWAPCLASSTAATPEQLTARHRIRLPPHACVPPRRTNLYSKQSQTQWQK